MHETAYKHLQSQIFITFFKPAHGQLRLNKLTKIEMQSFNTSLNYFIKYDHRKVLINFFI